MFNDVLAILFPTNCVACLKSLASSEEHICSICIQKLVRCDFTNVKDNKIEKIFWGRVNFVHTVSFFRFIQKGRIQVIFHHFKYKGAKEIGERLGEVAARELRLFDDIDFLIPVPIHKKKRNIRGYNQSEWIVKGMQKVLKKESRLDAIVKSNHTSSQTKKGRFGRWKNVESSFKLKNYANLEGKHILLIDDILTTGATIEACANELLKIKNIQLSVFTLAATY